MKKLISIIIVSILAITLASCKSDLTKSSNLSSTQTVEGSNTASESSTKTTPSVVSLVLSTEDDTLFALSDGTLELTTLVTVLGDAIKDVTYTSSDTNIAEVSETGIVTPKLEGSVTVTATSVFDNAFTDTIDLQFYKRRAPINGGLELEAPLFGTWTNSDSTVIERQSETVYSGAFAEKVNSAGNYTVFWQGFTLGEENDFEVGDYISINGMFNTTSLDLEFNLILEGVGLNESKTVLVSTNSKKLSSVDTWESLKSTAVKIPSDLLYINAKVEVLNTGTAYFDEIEVKREKSNNVTANIMLDGVVLSNYNDNIDEYNYVIEEDIPNVTVNLEDDKTTYSITPATEESMKTVVTITAEDGTTRIITINFISSTTPDLKSISVNQVELTNFDITRSDYYILLDNGTTMVPEVSFTATVQASLVEKDAPSTLPGTYTLSIGEKVYSIYFDVISVNQLIMGYPDMSFESTGENWGFDAAAISSEYSNSGTSSLKVQASGAGGWVGIDLAGNTYPSKGDSLKAGVYVYILPGDDVSGDLTIEIYGKESQGQIVNFVYNTKEEDYGKWIYIESGYSDAVSNENAYVQVVIKNWTNTVVYFDDVKLYKNITN